MPFDCKKLYKSSGPLNTSGELGSMSRASMPEKKRLAFSPTVVAWSAKTSACAIRCPVPPGRNKSSILFTPAIAHHGALPNTRFAISTSAGRSVFCGS